MNMKTSFNFDDRALFNGNVSDFRKRKWAREDQAAYAAMLGEALLNDDKRQQVEELGRAYEEYLKLPHQG